jgi:peptidoglycan LD-endopeptidase LytH
VVARVVVVVRSRTIRRASVRRLLTLFLVTVATVTLAAPTSLAQPASSGTATAAAATYVFPVQPASAASYGRDHHDYPATDLFAACGTTVVAPTAGVVDEVSRTDRWDPAVDDGATRGGLSVSIVGDDGVRYYGSHHQTIRSEIEPGVRVRAGQTLGTVGRTGSARDTPCHLHFGISPPCGQGDWQVRRGVIATWPYLDAWRTGTARSPAREVSAWRETNLERCPDGRVFPDVPPTSTHGPAIERLHALGVTRGCGGGRYCPDASVTRAQMASFLQRALGLPPGPATAYRDVDPGSPHAAAIGALREAGITRGCGDGRYCPEQHLPRDQMASLIQRAFDLPTGPTDRFVDVAPGSVHAPAIGALHDAAITRGCSSDGRSFCPAARVSRAQMASFLVRALDHRGR